VRSVNSSAEGPRFSVCTTNYRCAHALEAHLHSVYEVLEGVSFEYVVVDNYSRDGSWPILHSWSQSHSNFRAIQRRCAMGVGRNLAVAHSTGPLIVIVDTDVVYHAELPKFIEAWAARYPDVAVQAPFAGLYPRQLWNQVGGRRSLNTYEDVDMWLRIHALGRMRWCLVPMGSNLKETTAEGGFDHLSGRYPRWEQALRLIRREWDLWKTRRWAGVDLERILRENSVDFGFDVPIESWVQNRPRRGVGEESLMFGRFLFRILRS